MPDTIQTETRPRFYIPELDGLRFIAFLLVFIHNAPHVESSALWTALHNYGWIGVDLFFCLSGFLITRLLAEEHRRSGMIDIKYFYVRRILRIWPLYFLYIVIGLLFVLLTEGWISNLPAHLAGLATFTYDVVYLFLTFKVFGVFLHLWTISYEEQFYAVIPWILRTAMQNIKKVTLGHLLVIFVIGNLIRAIFIYFNVRHPAIYFLPITHFEAMLGGVAVGIGLFDNLLSRIHSWGFLLCGFVLNALIFQLPNTFEIGWNLMLTYPLVGIGMTLIVLGILKGDGTWVARILRYRILAYLGKISFGLYIFHLFSLAIIIPYVRSISDKVNISTTTQPIIFVVGGLVSTILLSLASYQLFEKKFLTLKEKFSSIASRPV